MSQGLATLICSVLKYNNYQGFIVGGAARDIFRNKIPHDFDVATDALPEVVVNLFSGGEFKTIPTGIKHGTVTVLWKNNTVEVTTFRSEATYSDNRHPDSVKFITTIEEDLARRDFTMNAIAIDPIEDQCIDPFDGRKDIEARTIRAVGNPLDRFKEDGLRCIRAVRFSINLNFKIEEETFKAIKFSLDSFRRVSIERIRDEFLKIISSDSICDARKVLLGSGLLAEFLPEALALIHPQNSHHSWDILEHTLEACQYARSNLSQKGTKDYIHLVLAAFFHDIGKPACAVEKEDAPGEYRFLGHEDKGADITREIMTRMKFSNEDIDRVCVLVKEHMFTMNRKWTPGAARRLIKRVGRDNIELLLKLGEADIYGTGREVDPVAEVDPIREVINKVLSAPEKVVTSVRDLAIDGNEVMKVLNIKPGPTVGEILRQLEEIVLDKPYLNKKEYLRFILSEIYCI